VLAIRYYRLKLGLSQTALGRLAGVEKAAICHIETGRRRPNDRLLEKLATALGVSPAFTLLRPVVVHQDAVFQDSAERVEV
jgi:transcriptional regulator with XRE-family HTH domain